MLTGYPFPKIYRGLLPQPSSKFLRRVRHAMAHCLGLNYGCMLRFTFNGHEYSGFVCTGCGDISCVEHQGTFCCGWPQPKAPDRTYYDGGGS